MHAMVIPVAVTSLVWTRTTWFLARWPLTLTQTDTFGELSFTL